MAKRMAILVALVGISGPAFGQMGGVDALTPGGALRSIRPLEEAADVGSADCEARYRSLRARLAMQPSKRKAALAVCRTLASAQEQESLASKAQ